MGSKPETKYRNTDEGPLRLVTFATQFAVGKFTVTFDEWDTCVREGGCQSNRVPSDAGQGRQKQPVVNVSHDDAQEYISWLSKKTGAEYRLMSEAEWEYAARAGTTTSFWWGDGTGNNKANCLECGHLFARKQPALVGSFDANPFGLHDMNGNVWQWVEDCYIDNYSGAPVDGSPRIVPACRFSVLRGGAYNTPALNLRSAHRANARNDQRFGDAGFRVARSLDIASSPQPDNYPSATQSSPSLTPKSEFKDCGNCPLLVVVPGGRYNMGSAINTSTSPVHEAAITNKFAVGKYAVTFEEWELCAAEGGCASRKVPYDNGWGRNKRPVINITWRDAKEYIAWLSKKTGKTYRLLTESEWEYTARAGTSTTHYWGNEIGLNMANCIGCVTAWEKRQTAPVGSFAANAFGLHDMQRNVWQWVEDCWSPDYRGWNNNGTARATGDCSRRTLRGGSWRSELFDFSVFVREARSEYHKSDIIGFRLARTIDE